MAAGIGGTGTAATASGAGTDRKTIAGNFDSFLLLLTTQLKNQNPMEPLDTNQFTQQLVQFASVEQQIKSNETLHSLLTSSKSSIVSSASNFVGMNITADGATTQLSNGSAEWKLNLARAGSGTITIKDQSGSVVATDSKTCPPEARATSGTARPLRACRPRGDYTITVTARDVSGGAVTVKTEIAGRVDSVDMAGDNPVLVVDSTRGCRSRK